MSYMLQVTNCWRGIRPEKVMLLVRWYLVPSLDDTVQEDIQSKICSIIEFSAGATKISDLFERFLNFKIKVD